MGKLKDRLTTTISADMVQWHRLDEHSFIGTIFNSIVEPKFEDNVVMRINFVDVTHYPELTGHWESHFLGKTIEGHYIRMDIKHQLRLRS